jgi:energy-coupling factor transporter ATP-binding protein EcfA2
MSDFFDKVGTKVPERKRVTGVAHLLNTATAPDEIQADPNRSPAMTGERRWACHHDRYWGATQTHERLPPGMYRCDLTPLGPTLIRQAVNTDDLLELPDDATSDIIAEFDKFWTLKPAFAERGFLHKRGYLLYGPPGSGKTSCVALLIARLIRDYGGVVLLVDNPASVSNCLSLARKIEPERPLIAIMEDLDALVAKFGDNEYLAMLDGEMQVDGICFLATSNYPEHLDKRFVDRPSRFDTIREIAMPSAKARRVYLQSKEPSLSELELEQWIRLTDDFSVAHLKELIIAVKCLGQPLKVAVYRLQEMRTTKPRAGSSNGGGYLRGALNEARTSNDYLDT